MDVGKWGARSLGRIGGFSKSPPFEPGAEDRTGTVRERQSKQGSGSFRGMSFSTVVTLAEQVLAKLGIDPKTA